MSLLNDSLDDDTFGLVLNLRRDRIEKLLKRNQIGMPESNDVQTVQAILMITGYRLKVIHNHRGAGNTNGKYCQWIALFRDDHIVDQEAF